MPRMFVIAVGLALWSTSAAADVPVEAFEIGKDNHDQLPRGKEADGIQGDFVLRNAHVELLISGNLPQRRANMTTHYGTGAATQGTLYDFSVRGSDNDQLTLFAPGDQRGMLSAVEVQQDGSDGQAIVIAHRTPARGEGHGISHIYWLEKNAKHLLVISVYENGDDKPWKLKPEPYVKGLLNVGHHDGIHFGDSMNPSDHQGYAWGAVAHAEASDAPLEEIEAGKEIELAPGERKTIALAMAPGHSPAEAYGVVAAARGSVGTLSASLRSRGAAVSTATLEIIPADGTTLPAYPRDDGSVQIQLPPGTYRYRVTDVARPTVSGNVEIVADGDTEIEVELEPAGRIALDVRGTGEDAGIVFPCKAQFIGLGGTQNPHFGVDIQAHGCRNQYHSERGDFSVEVPPGKYLIMVTRGIEYTHFVDVAVVKAGETVEVRGDLQRVVDTSGWISSDFHNHSTPSGDNYCGTDDRVINLAAEQIEFAPTTEHNRIYDWAPHIEKLGLKAVLSTVVGIELTGPGPHFNSFPFKSRPWLQDGGAPVWQTDPRINAIVLRDFQGGGADRYVQINHPNVGRYFRDRNADGIADGGFVDLERLVDAAEVWSTEILNTNLRVDGRENRAFAWLQLLNQGRMMYCVAVSDAHSVFGNGVGGWRTYLPSSTDDPSAVDSAEITRHAKAGRMVVTNGPFLEVELDDGTLPGGHAIAEGEVELLVKVQCTDWIDIDRVQVLVNGRQPADLNFTRADHKEMFGNGVVKFEQRIKVPLSSDAHLIVAAVGEGFNLKTGYGESWQSKMHPVAYNNPIFIDVDGNGFRANGDNLGQSLPVGKY